MKFNIDKCHMHIMHITHKRKPFHTVYNMNGTILKAVTTHTYLGVEINSKFSRTDDVNTTVSEANKVLGLLRRNLNSCSRKVKETAYKS